LHETGFISYPGVHFTKPTVVASSVVIYKMQQNLQTQLDNDFRKRTGKFRLD